MTRHAVIPPPIQNLVSSISLMESAIPCETPSTRGPGSRGLVRDTLKELRQGRGEETRAIRALADYASSPDLVGGEWRLPWTHTRVKTQLHSDDEKRIVAVTTALLLSRLVHTALVAKDYKRANAYIGQAFKAIQIEGTSQHTDLSLETIGALQAIFEGLAHELLVIKLLDTTTGNISKANAAVHARIAMYAQDKFASAIQRAPKPVKPWLENHRRYALSACHLIAGYEQLALSQIGMAIAHFKASTHSITKQRTLEALNEAESANRLVSFQPVPTSTTLPAGRCVVNFTKDYF